MLKINSIKTRLNIIGGLFTLLIIIIFVLAFNMAYKTEKDSFVVNIAGKQRMLVQKMSKEIFFLHFRDGYDFRILNSAIETFEDNLYKLFGKNDKNGLKIYNSKEVEEKLGEIKNKWKPFKKELINIKDTIQQIKDDTEILNINTEKLLDRSDKIVSLMERENFSAYYINISGRQRMLTQRMGMFVKKYLKDGDKQNYILFLEAKKLYDETINSFLKDDTIKEKNELYIQVSKTYKYWQEYKAYIENLIKQESRINDSIDYIYQNNISLLDTVDDAVFLYAKKNEEKNQKFIISLYIISVISILIVFYAYSLARQINLGIKEFIEKSKMLKNDISSADSIFHSDNDELKEVSDNLKDYIQKLNKAMTDSSNTILKVENIANEIQEVTQGIGRALVNLDIDNVKKEKLKRKVDAVEDIAIESTENLIYVSKMLTKLQKTLVNINHDDILEEV